MRDDNLKHCPRCHKHLGEPHHTYTFTYCDECIDKRKTYRTTNEEHYKDMSKQHNTQNNISI